MSKFKFLIIIIIIAIIFALCFLFYINKTGQPNISKFAKNNIKRYSLLLKKEPTNCFYLDQIACSYQVLNNFDQAIKYYKETLKYCPNSPLSQFQLGVCYYVKTEKDLGLAWMNKAIKSAKETGDDQLAAILETEKVSWFNKWDSIKELDWNKIKKE